MRFERAKVLSRSLRFRLTLWNTVLILSLLLANLLAVREGLRWALSRMMDTFLQEELTLAVEYVNRLGGRPDELRDELDRQAASHQRRHLFVQLLDGRGAVVWSSKWSPSDDLLPAGVAAFDAPATLGEFRFVYREVTVPG